MPEAQALQHRIPVDGCTLQVVDEGDAGQPAVLLAHSIMTSSRMWQPQVEALRAMGLRVLRADSRGHGGSGMAGDTPLSIDRLADDVVAVLDALAIERVHFIGLSLGGMVGFSLGQRHAQRLASLVICDARADSPPAFARPWDERIALARDRGMSALVQPTVDRWFGDRVGALDRSALAELREDIARTAVSGFVATARALQGFDYTSGLHGMPPATLIVGELDGVLPEVMAELVQQIPAGKLSTIPSAGHLPNLEQPAVFDRVLTEHFSRVAL